MKQTLIPVGILASLLVAMWIVQSALAQSQDLPPDERVDPALARFADMQSDQRPGLPPSPTRPQSFPERTAELSAP